MQRPLVFLSAVLLSVACVGDTPAVRMVKSGSLKGCPGSTLDAMVDGFMGKAAWESIVDDDGKTYVNISGDINYADKPVRAVLQFATDTAERTFEFRSAEFNGVAMIGLVGVGLLEKMCENVTSGSSSESSTSEQEDDHDTESSASPPGPPTDHFGSFSGTSGLAELSLTVLPTSIVFTQNIAGESFEMCQATLPDGVGYEVNVLLSCSEEMELAGVSVGLSMQYSRGQWYVSGTGAMSGLSATLTRDY